MARQFSTIQKCAFAFAFLFLGGGSRQGLASPFRKWWIFSGMAEINHSDFRNFFRPRAFKYVEPSGTGKEPSEAEERRIPRPQGKEVYGFLRW